MFIIFPYINMNEKMFIINYKYILIQDELIRTQRFNSSNGRGMSLNG